MLPRLRDVSLRERILRGTNAALTPWLCRPLRLTHVVEFPKSGGSWVRNMLAAYLGVPPYLGDRLLRRDDVVQTHRCYRRAYAKPVVVVRDPRDVYVSFYYHETLLEGREHYRPVERFFRHDPRRPLQEDFRAYLTAKIAVAKRVQPRFSYSAFARSWIDRTHALIVRYEDFLDDAAGALTRALAFLGRPIDAERVRAVVAEQSFEASTLREYGVRRTPGEADPTRFIRKGVAGDWRNHFDRAACEILERHEGEALRLLAYEADDGWIERFAGEAPADVGAIGERP